MNSFYSKNELKKLGFKSMGENVLISRKASIYGTENISIANNVRVDDFVILSGKIEIGNYTHIAAFSALFAGNAGIILKDFSGLSSRVSIYAISDDYSGEALTNPMVSDEYKKIEGGQVVLDKHVIVGASSVILPNVVIGEGSAVGSLSLVNKSLDSWGIYIGTPVKKIKTRSKNLLNLEKEFVKKSSTFKVITEALN